MKLITIIQGLVFVQMLIMAKYGSAGFLAISIDLSILEIAILQALKINPRTIRRDVNSK